MAGGEPVAAPLGLPAIVPERGPARSSRSSGRAGAVYAAERPVTPLVAVWLQDALYFHTGAAAAGR